MSEVLAIETKGLTFAHNEFSPPVLQDVNIEVKVGERVVIIGSNGAGKSTLLRILAGKRLVNSSCKAEIFGQNVFTSMVEGVTYLGTEWAMNPVVRGDIAVSHFLDSVGGYRHKERRNILLDLLDVNLDWRMHQVSDGERRRVQLVMGLMSDWRILLLDEVTVDLDCLVRRELLLYLKQDSITRGATIVYCTHIFDGLDSFPNNIIHLSPFGRIIDAPISWPIKAIEKVKVPEFEDGEDDLVAPGQVSLLRLALGWLKFDVTSRRKEEAGIVGRQRGARPETKDAKTFFEKYDYSAGKA